MPSIPSKNTRCRFGVSTRDVTPPLGVYARWWGAAMNDLATGVHRPLIASALVFGSLENDAEELVLVAIDYCVFDSDDERALRATIRERAGIPEANLLLATSHTHSSANANTRLSHLPGGDRAQAFLDDMADAVGDAIQQARNEMAPAWVTWGMGKCTLAKNRDYWDADEQMFVTGYNPDGAADDALLVGRISGDDGDLRGVIFNYGCHPTTLAFDNTLFSTDYIGAAREAIFSIYGVPSFFLQGALGEVGPRLGFVGDPAVADQNGRQLGYAVASTLESIPPAATELVYKGIRKSGADLGIWLDEPMDAAALAGTTTLRTSMTTVTLALKDLPPISELQQELDQCTDRVEQERLRRKIGKRRALGDGDTFALPLWCWRLGDALLVAIPEEPYQILQTSLRAHFADRPVLVLSVTNGSHGYLPPSDRYGDYLYQVWQSPFVAGSLEAVIDAAETALASLVV
jgi:hypothetical protein